MKEVKSNLRWPGGKTRMMKILDTFLPVKVDKYLETFTGGGSVLLYVVQKFHPKKIYANDIDTNLVNYYETVRTNAQLVIDQCLELKQAYTAETFAEAFKGLDRTTASGFFASNKTSFSGLNSNYSKKAYDSNFSVQCINKISEVSDVIKDVNFINSDFRFLDDTITEPIDGYFIYLDPPYYGNRTVGLYGKGGKLHKEFDHEVLFNWVERHKDNNLIMMSYDDSPYIRELYKDYYIYDFDFVYTMTNVGGHNCKTGKEIVITNYEVEMEKGLF